MVLVMVCATNSYNMMLSPIMSILMLHWTFVACNRPLYVGVKNERICILLKLSQFPSLKSVFVVSLQTVLCKLHTYIRM